MVWKAVLEHDIANNQYVLEIIDVQYARMRLLTFQNILEYKRFQTPSIAHGHR